MVLLGPAVAVRALPLGLRAVDASAESADGHPLDAALDGIISGTNGWTLQNGNFEQQFAIFATDKPVSAAMIQLQFFFSEQGTASHFQNFGVSLTMDETRKLAEFLSRDSLERT